MGTDSFYYIMDYSGHYYRLNQADQLVAAANEQDATVFTFAQANSRIRIGKKAAFYCMIPVEDSAEEGDDEVGETNPDAAHSPLISEDSMNEIQEKMESDESISSVKELTYVEVTEPVEKNVSSYDLSEMDWAEYLIHFTYLVEGIKAYRDDLARKHSDIEQKICDILHYIELCETGDKEAIDLIELLRVCRENRRDIKDELHRIEYFQTNLGTNANAAKAKQALRSMKGLETRKYKPRKYEELFENCVMKERRLQKKDLCAAQTFQESKKERFSAEQLPADEGGEEMMLEERRYTPYDGKKNDWLLFARQQADFYRNAGQYIRNLQMDIHEIDCEIEDILQGTEDANCNVAQGYKVFKRLKELRLERKDKWKELDCLYALTCDLDCEALAAACEANLTEVERVMGIVEQRDAASIQPADKQEEIQETDAIQDMVG